MRVLIDSDAEAQTLALAVVVRSSSAEDRAPNGVGQLVALSLFGENDNLSREAVAREIYAVGGSIATHWTPDYIATTCITTPAALEDAAYVVGQALKGAEFDPATVGASVRALAERSMNEAADPITIGTNAVRAALFGSHRYGRGTAGAEAARAASRRDGLRTYGRAAFVPDNTVVVVSGNAAEERVRRAMENQFVDYRAPVPARPMPPAADPPTSPPLRDRLTIRSAAQTAAIVAGYRGPGMASPDSAAFQVLAALVGGGKGSRIYARLREQSGIGYAVGAATEINADAAMLTTAVEFAAVGRPSDQSSSVAGALTEATESVLTSPPGLEEVRRAREYSVGVHVRARERTRDRALALGVAELLGGGFEKDAGWTAALRAVTADDVLRVAREVLANRVVALVLPEVMRSP